MSRIDHMGSGYVSQTTHRAYLLTTSNSGIGVAQIDLSCEG